MTSVGYSGTPLPKKLGIKPEHKVTALHAPDGLVEWLDGITPQNYEAGSACDIVIAFFEWKEDLEAAIFALGESIRPNGSIWICWPKKAAKVPTDISEQDLRDLCLPMGLVDNKVCAVSEVWSGLRFVWRVELR